MTYKEQLIKINDYEWKIPRQAREGMNVDGVIIANKEVLEGIEEDCIMQLTNVAMMPGVINPVMAMPDAHFGYGLPMGSVAAFDLDTGVISAGLCGFDINCGINLIRTNLTVKDIDAKKEQLVKTLFKNIPCGVGSKGRLRLKEDELDEVFVRGINWAIEKGYGCKEDIEKIEENGCMPGADPSKISKLAKDRGKAQLGTLGAGNHFLEIQAVGEIFDEETAAKWGIKDKNQVFLMIHCGSRGLGHQVATDYLKSQEEAVHKYKIELPDRQLACAPFNSPEGRDYYAAMVGAVNYSFTNRWVMTHWIRESFEEVFGRKWQDMDMYTLYGLCHNVVKVEEHIVEGKKKKILVHRKGATRAFPDIPVLLPGSMGTASYILKGTEIAMQKTFGSSAHGAGRAMSRNEAISTFRGQEISKELLEKGIMSKATSWEVLAEEAPKAYKDVDIVVDSVDKPGISTKVAKMIPLAVIKG